MEATMLETFRYASGEEPVVGDVVMNIDDASITDTLRYRVTKALSEGVIDGGHIDLVFCGSYGRQGVKYARVSQYTLVERAKQPALDLSSWRINSFEERKRESYSAGVPLLGPSVLPEMNKMFEAWRVFVEAWPSPPAYSGRYDAADGIANMSLAEVDELACNTTDPRSWTINATLKQQKDRARWRLDDYDLNREPIRGRCSVVGCGLQACMHPRPFAKHRE
jgi:hypothetical protein